MKNEQETPLMVSIMCITYNQESYIRQCLDGFVMQKTNFRFQAIVHDDASTDKTASIVCEYAENYPDIIKPIIETENQFSKHDGSLRKIMRNACQGKYIAICEGDDFWIDPNKLQKQVTYLESNLDYSMCFHGASILNETDNPFFLDRIEDRDYSAKELLNNWVVPTASIVIRRNVYEMMHDDNRIINNDINIIINACTHGKVRGFSDIMSVYRVQSNGITIKRAKDNMLDLQQKYLGHYTALKELYPKVSSSIYKKKFADTYINIGVLRLKTNVLLSFIALAKGFLYSPSRFFERIYKKLNK